MKNKAHFLKLLPLAALALALYSPCNAQSQRIYTVAGNGSGGFSGDGGAATAAQLNAPVSVIVDGAGNQYISDKSNNRIRKVSPAGIISTIAGTGSAAYTGDGGPATAATLNTNAGIALDASGNLYIADQGNNCLRKISTSGIITTVAGTGTSGFSGDGGPATAARLNHPEDVAVSTAGDIFIADYANSRIRKINAAGTMSTLAGTSSFGSSGDGGPATAAQTVPYRLAVDAAGNVYAAEYWYNKIRKINTAGIITTIVGDGTAAFTGDGGPATAARLNGPYGVAVNTTGIIYINDQLNHRVRKVDLYGNISTYAGTGTFGYTGDGGPATAARLGDTRNIAVNDSGDVFMADITYHCARVIKDVNHAPSFTAGASQSFTRCQDSGPYGLNSLLTISDADSFQTESWEVATAPAHGSLAGFSYSATSTGGTVVPAGLSYTPAAGYSGTDTFRVRVLDGARSDTIAIYVTITPSASAGIISGAAAVCLVHTTPLTSTISGGTWLATNGNASITITGTVMGIIAGLDTIQYIVTTSCGTDTATHVMAIEAVLDIGGITGPDSVCPGYSVTLTHSYPGGTWLSSDSTIAKSMGGGAIRGIAPGSVTIMYIAVNSCGADTAFMYGFEVSSSLACNTAITQVTTSASPALRVSPNPSGGAFSITLATGTGQRAPVTIIDMLGRQVAAFVVEAGIAKEVQTDIPAGVYFVKAQSGEGTVTERLVVTR